ncbi:MAG: hypothetical protein KF729_25720 [Sandaracinaceae bacterium]|nr:hypothetical protein [Sandaracinaceae bacterium]
MSWGYIADFRLTVDSAAWTRLSRLRPSEVTLRAGWSGLRDRALEEAFGRPTGRDETFAELLEWPAYHRESVHEVALDGPTATVRVCLVLEKSQLELCQPLATLLHAAKREPATGALRLVNDGTYDGEDGVHLSLSEGEVRKTKLRHHAAALEELSTELIERLQATPSAPPVGEILGYNPRTGQPVYAAAKKPKRG